MSTEKDVQHEVGRHEVRIGGVVDGDPEAELAVSLIAPASLATTQPQVLLCAYPGATYSRGYFDIEWKGSREYSQAEYHARRGWIVAAIDHLGVGDSSPADPAAGMAPLVQADAAVVEPLVSGLRDGTLVDGLDPVGVDVVLGAGQSMGGHLVTRAQAERAPFDGVAILGFSAIQTQLPSPPSDDVDQLTYAFHWDDEDPELVAADMDSLHGSALPPHWRSPTVPAAVVSLLEPGVTTTPAAAITAPVFLGCGEREVVPDPQAEPAAYRSSADVTLHVVDGMAHMHNFARTRVELWEALHAWGTGLARRKG